MDIYKQLRKRRIRGKRKVEADRGNERRNKTGCVEKEKNKGG